MQKKKEEKKVLPTLLTVLLFYTGKERGLVGWLVGWFHILAAPLIAHSSTLGFFYNVSTLRSSACLTYPIICQ